MKKNGKISFFNIILSYIVGVGFAFLSGAVIHEHFSPGMSNIIIGIVAISGEKIGNWFVFTLKIDYLLTKMFDILMHNLEKLIK